MAKLKGSKTEKNIRAAFVSEAQAHTKYLYYASQAEKDGYLQIGALFWETALNEKEHAKIWYKLLHGNKVPPTSVNIKSAANEEKLKYADMYVEFAKTAREEGLDHIADLFEKVGRIERKHEERYHRLLANVEEGQVFSRKDEQLWQCANCGHIITDKNSPDLCSVCKHPKAFFKIYTENF